MERAYEEELVAYLRGQQQLPQCEREELFSREEYEEIRKGFHSYNLPLSVDSLNAGDVLAATKKDKKMEAGHIKFILMDGIGKSFIDKTVTDEELLQAIREILI